jgi:hypothetical protein
MDLTNDIGDISGCSQEITSNLAFDKYFFKNIENFSNKPFKI